MKTKPNQEVFIDGDKHIMLTANFGFLQAINSRGRDVALIQDDLMCGLMPPIDIRNVLASSFVDIDDCERDSAAEDLVERYGLQECSIVARHMLSHAMLGDVKKSLIARSEELGQMMAILQPTPSESLKKLGLLSVVITMISTGLVCGIFSVLGKHIL